MGPVSGRPAATMNPRIQMTSIEQERQAHEAEHRVHDTPASGAGHGVVTGEARSALRLIVVSPFGRRFRPGR